MINLFSCFIFQTSIPTMIKILAHFATTSATAITSFFVRLHCLNDLLFVVSIVNTSVYKKIECCYLATISKISLRNIPIYVVCLFDNIHHWLTINNLNSFVLSKFVITCKKIIADQKVF